jgi:hypothetical protein
MVFCVLQQMMQLRRDGGAQGRGDDSDRTCTIFRREGREANVFRGPEQVGRISCMARCQALLREVRKRGDVDEMCAREGALENIDAAKMLVRTPYIFFATFFGGI